MIRKIYKNNPLRFITYTIVGIVVFFLLLPFLLVVANWVSNDMKETTISYNGARPTIVITGSMEPTINVNGIILVEDVEYSDIEEGDIIRYTRNDGMSIVHRVYIKNPDYIVTWGDNNPDPDNWIVRDSMIDGRVTEIHNEYAPYISAIFGRINVANFGKSLFRVFVGFILAAAVVTIFLLGIYYLFEIITINYFWLRKSDTMQDSINWLDDRTDKAGFNEIVENYKQVYSKSSGIYKVYLLFIFRKYYDVMCSEESKAKKTVRWRKIMLKSINKK